MVGISRAVHEALYHALAANVGGAASGTSGLPGVPPGGALPAGARSAFDPRCLLKIVLLGYSKGLFSSRRIAAACRSNVVFMTLSGDCRPHLREEILSIFTKVLLICCELNLIGGSVFAVDGCKISSNASKEWSGTFQELEAKKQKLGQRLKLIIGTHACRDSREGRKAPRSHGEAYLQQRLQRQHSCNIEDHRSETGVTRATGWPHRTLPCTETSKQLARTTTIELARLSGAFSYSLVMPLSFHLILSGLRILTFLIICPSLRSSVSRYWHFALSADTTTNESQNDI